MEPQVSTNIVRVETPSEEVKSEEVKPEEPKDYNKNLERDLVQFLQEEFKENKNGEFWKYVRDFANGKLGEGPEIVSVSLMSKEQINKFAKQEIPWGQFSGTKVETILKRNPEYLMRLANQPLTFQKQLRRFLQSYPVKNKAKQEDK